MHRPLGRQLEKFAAKVPFWTGKTGYSDNFGPVLPGWAVFRSSLLILLLNARPETVDRLLQAAVIKSRLSSSGCL